MHRLTEVAEEGSFHSCYFYDSLNRRLAKRITYWDARIGGWGTSQLLRYIYLGEREVGALNEAGELVEFRALGRGKGAEIGASVALELNSKLFCPLHDHRGNIIALIDAESGKVVEAMRYSAFGEERALPKYRNTSPWRFASKRFDKETGFSYFGKRYYLPTAGRWITPDPLGFGDGPNMYAYVLNSPMLLFDPYGLSFCDDVSESLGDSFRKMGESTMVDREDTLDGSHLKDYPQSFDSSMSNEEAMRVMQGGPFERAAVLTAGITAFSVIFAPMTCGASLGAGSLALASGRVLSVSTTLTGACAATAMKVSSVAQPIINAIGSMVANDPSGTFSTTVVKRIEAESALVRNGGVNKDPLGRGTGCQRKFPENPDDLLPELPRDNKGRIPTADNLRIRPEKHAFEVGHRYNPRHHEQHYHVELRRDIKGVWKNDNIEILKPPGYKAGDGTGFLVGEGFPGG
ncbi:MAG: rhs family protein [Chlamydiia bacterium]|nr:rhs family protein [Chlamydiia bacterium]